MKLENSDMAQSIDLARIPFENESMNIDDPNALRAQVSSTEGHVTIVGAYGCSLVVYYSVSFSGIEVSLKLETPIGSKTLGSVDLNKEHPEAKIGGSIGPFKAEAIISFDFNTHILKLEGEIGFKDHTKKGSVSVHL